MIIHAIQNRPLLKARLWIQTAAQIFRQRITMLWLFHFTNQDFTNGNTNNNFN